MAEDPFRPLRIEYLAGARARLPELQSLAANAPDDANALMALRRLAHNLRGSGGFYGFGAISEAAAALEELIIRLQEGAAARDDAALTAAAAKLAGAIQDARLPGT